MSSFYRRRTPAQMGFLPLIMAAVPAISDALRSHPLGTVQEEEPSSLPLILGVVGGVAVLGGLAYFVVRS